MSKDDQVFLKPTVFGGFQKKAVLSYIFELNETTQDAQQKLGEKVGELEKSNEALSEKLGETEQRLLAVQGELNAAKEQIEENAVKKAEADANLKKLEDEIERQNQTLAQKNSDISRYISVNCDLEKEIKDLGKRFRRSAKNAIIWSRPPLSSAK